MGLLLENGWTPEQIQCVLGLNPDEQIQFREKSRDRVKWLRERLGEFRNRAASAAKQGGYSSAEQQAAVGEADVQLIHAFTEHFGALPTTAELNAAGLRV